MTAPFGLSDDNSRTFTAGEAIAQHAAVTLKSDGNVENADSDTDKVLGFASRAAASGAHWSAPRRSEKTRPSLLAA